MRQQLQQLSKSEVIEVILQQQARIEQLQARVAQLEEQIKRLTQPPRTPPTPPFRPLRVQNPTVPRASRRRSAAPSRGIGAAAARSRT